jgi:inner membrane protein
MFLLAHMGFTAAPGVFVARWWGENRGFKSRVPDLRWLLAGSILPDIVDKTIGQMLFKPYFENGRIFCHTVIFTILMFVAGVYRQRYRDDNRILLLAFGMASHLMLDKIWLEAETAYWPALGPFVRNPSLQTLAQQISDALSDPFFWTSEIGGLAFLIMSLRYLGVKKPGDLRDFLLTGLSPSLVQYEAGY